jgi:hypothetical protein
MNKKSKWSPIRVLEINFFEKLFLASNYGFEKSVWILDFEHDVII